MCQTKQEYDYAISVLRVLATLFIILCHMGSNYGSVLVGQFFNVGVPIFFMISGYLYGRRSISQPGTWLYARYVRLLVPSLCWLALKTVLDLVHGSSIVSQQDVVMIFLNLHGLNFVFTRMADLGSGPWFLTCIMLCYVLLLAYLKIEERHPKIACIFEWGGIFPLLVFCVLTLIGISIIGALAFFAGFVVRRKGLLDEKRPYNVVIAFVVFTVAIGMRLLSHRFLDGTLLHNEIIAPVSHVILASSFLVGVKWLFDILPRPMKAIARSAWFRHLDRISIYTYVCHGYFIFVLELGLPIVLLLVLYFGVVVVVSTVFWRAGEWLTKQIDRCVCYCFG